MLTRRRGLALSVCAIALGLALPAHAADATVTGALASGLVGELRLGMRLAEVELLLHQRIPPEILKIEPVVVSFTEVRDLESLGIDKLAGFQALGASLVFVDPVAGERRLRSVAINFRCDELPAIAEQLGGWEGTDPAHAYAWALRNTPACHLALLRASGN